MKLIFILLISSTLFSAQFPEEYRLARSKSAPHAQNKKLNPQEIGTMIEELPALSLTSIDLKQKNRPKTANQMHSEVHPDILANALLLVNSPNQTEIKKGIQIAMLYAHTSLEARHILVEAYIKQPFNLSPNLAKIIYDQLFEKACKTNNQTLIKECLNFCLFEKYGMKQNFLHAEILAIKQNTDDRKKTLKKIAIYLQSTNQHERACDFFYKLQTSITDENDITYLYATIELAKCHLEHKYQGPSVETEVKWLETAFNFPFVLLKKSIDNQVLAERLRQLAFYFYTDKTPQIDITLRLLQKAYVLGSLRASVEYVFMLLKTDKSLALKILHQILPARSLAKYEKCLYQDNCPTITVEKSLINLAIIAAQYYSPDNNEFGNAQLYRYYLSYAAVAGKKRAIINVGYYLIKGTMGFKKDMVRGYKLLQSIPKSHKLYPDTVLAMANYDLLLGEYDKALEDSLLALNAANPEERFINRVLSISNAFIKVQRYKHSEIILKKTISILSNNSPLRTKYYLFLGYAQLYQKKHEEALQTFTTIALENDPVALYNSFIIENLLFNQPIREAGVRKAMQALLKNPQLLTSTLNNQHAISPFFGLEESPTAYRDRAEHIKALIALSINDEKDALLTHENTVSIQPFLNYAIQCLQDTSIYLTRIEPEFFEVQEALSILLKQYE